MQLKIMNCFFMYQPQMVIVGEGKVCIGAEALIRWQTFQRLG